MKLLTILFSCLFLTSCTPYNLLYPDTYSTSGYIVRVESDTEWTATIQDLLGSRVEGGWSDRGLQVRPPACWQVRKRGVIGIIRAFGTYRNYYKGATHIPIWDDRASVEPYAVIRGCM